MAAYASEVHAGIRSEKEAGHKPDLINPKNNEKMHVSAEQVRAHWQELIQLIKKTIGMKQAIDASFLPAYIIFIFVLYCLLNQNI